MIEDDDVEVIVIVGDMWHPDFTWVEGSGWHFTPGGKAIEFETVVSSPADGILFGITGWYSSDHDD